MKTIIEPFRIKMVEPIKLTTREQREQLFELARSVFTKEDWQAIDVIEDPLFGTVITKGYERLYGLITDGQVEDLKSANTDSK